MQRATVNNTRFQMLIERTSLQQARVDVLTRQLENIHSQGADMKAAKPQLEQQIKDAEERLDRTLSRTRMLIWSRVLRQQKRISQGWHGDEERLLTREAALDSELQAEQLKLLVIKDELLH